MLAGIGMILPLGGMIKNPWKPKHDMDITGDGTLWTTGWTLVEQGEKVYLGRDTGAIAEEGSHGFSFTGVSRLVRMRPEDLSAGAMETVFPLLEEDVNDGDKYSPDAEVYEAHMHSIHGSRNAVMLIRLRSQDAARATLRAGQEDFHYGDYFAYSKICTTSVARPRCTRPRPTNPVPVPPVAVRCAAVRQAVWPAARPAGAAHRRRRGRLPLRQRQLH